MQHNQPPNQTVPNSPDVVVIGGGLAGLTAAAIVARSGKHVVVYEKQSTPGGQARSTTKEGFTFNRGPHALYRGGSAERVLTDLGVKVAGGSPAVKGRVVLDGRSEIAPAGPVSLLRTRALGARDKAAVAGLLGRLPKLASSEYAAQTADAWVDDVAPREKPNKLMRALVRLSTYANDLEHLSAEVAISQLQVALTDGVLYLDHGWQSLVDGLRAIPNVHVVTGEGLDAVPDAPAVIVAAGGPQLAGTLLGRTYDVGPAALASSIDLGLRRAPEHDVLIGCDAPLYFSNHSAVAQLSPDGQFTAAAMQYLSEGEDPDPDAITAFVRQAGVRDDDIVVSRRLHRMVAITALATATGGGLAGRPAVTDTGFENVFVAGDWVGPVGHLADASVASAEAAAKAALSILASRSTHVVGG